MEGEEILKRAKLVHVHDKEGFVVTKTDETYHFIHGGLGDAKIDRIPELCRVRVKGTHIENKYCKKLINRAVLIFCLY